MNDYWATFPRPEYQITVVHGRMKAQEKEDAMQGFKAQNTDHGVDYGHRGWCQCTQCYRDDH